MYPVTGAKDKKIKQFDLVIAKAYHLLIEYLSNAIAVLSLYYRCTIAVLSLYYKPRILKRQLIIVD